MAPVRAAGLQHRAKRRIAGVEWRVARSLQSEVQPIERNCRRHLEAAHHCGLHVVERDLQADDQVVVLGDWAGQSNLYYSTS